MLISLSAIPLSLALPHIRGWDKNRYAAMFKKFHAKYRIYLPLDGTGAPINDVASLTRKLVEAELAKSKIEISNYVAGTATDGRRTFRIGKLLPEELQLKFASDPARKGFKSGAMVVISCHPYDLLGMSFDRGWKSCTNFVSGEGKSYVMRDIQAGTLIAYLVKNDDKNINNPIARVRLLPFKNDDNKLYFVPDSIYGHAPPAFLKTVASFCKRINAGAGKGWYELHHAVYHELVGNMLSVGVSTKASDLKYCADSERVMATINSLRGKPLSSIDTYIVENNFVEPEVLQALFDRVLSLKQDLLRDSILFKFAENHKTPTDVLEKILDMDEKYATVVLYNKNATQEMMLHGLAKYPIAKYIALHARAKAPVLRKILAAEPKTLGSILLNPNCPEDLLRENVEDHAINLATRDEPWLQQLVLDAAIKNKNAVAISMLLMNTGLDKKIRESVWNRREQLDADIQGIRWYE